MQFNPINLAPPGHSLTQPRGKWPWDKPAVFSDPSQAVSFIVDKLERPAVRRGYMKMMLAGVSIEDMTQSISMGGFAKGYFNPDIAELIQTPISFYLMGIAVDNGIPVRVFSDTKEGLGKEDDGMDDETLLNAVRLQNPEIYSMSLEREHQMLNKQTTRSQGMLGVDLPPEEMAGLMQGMGPEGGADIFEGPSEMEDEV